jgi:hypothetical protein
MLIKNIPIRTGNSNQERKKVVLVEIPTYENILPLASGYIQACAQEDVEVGAAHTFEIVSYPVTDDRHKLLEELAGKYAQIYTFSCYIWNMKLVSWLLKELRERQPHAHYLLGGPQVMNHAATYLADAPENVYVCNGEGENSSPRKLRLGSVISWKFLPPSSRASSTARSSVWGSWRRTVGARSAAPSATGARPPTRR